MAAESIKKTCKSLGLALRQSFILKEQCNLIRQAIDLLKNDVIQDPNWYNAGEKLCEQLLRYLKKFLRFARINLKVTETRQKGLGELRKARSLCNVNKLRTELTNYGSEFQGIILSSRTQKRIGAAVGDCFSGAKLAVAYSTDKESIVSLFAEVFQSVQKMQGMESASKIVRDIVQPLQAKDTFDIEMDDFDDPELNKFSFKLEYKLLGMISQDPTPFDMLKLEKIFKSGRFGEIHEGTQGGVVPIMIQKISADMVQELSSEGRIKLFSTLRSNLTKGNGNLVKVLGTTLYDNALYITLDKVHFSLHHLLHGHDGLSPNNFTPNDLLYVFHSVTVALDFLQKDGVIHGDIRPDNIYFTRRGKVGSVKLANFNYELNLQELHWSNWSEEGRAYQAPEVLGTKKFSAASDIYALAICIWESTQDNKLPFADLDKTRLFQEVKAGGRPEFTGTVREASWLVSLATKCWNAKAWERPTVAAVLQELNTLVVNSGASVDQLGSFVQPLVKGREQKLVNKGDMKGYGSLVLDENAREMLNSRKIPAITDTPQRSPPRSPPRDVPRSPPRSPPRDIPRSPPRSPARVVPAVSDIAEPAPMRELPAVPTGKGRELPPPPSPGRRIPQLPAERALPPAPLSPTRALPAIPGDRALPPRPNGNRPLPAVTDSPPFSPARTPPASPARSLPALNNPPMSPRRALPPKPQMMQPPSNRPLPAVNETLANEYGAIGNTMGRVENEREHSFDGIQPNSPDTIPQPEVTGVNGLTAKEVRHELIRFYKENDPDMLSELNNLVNWCMVNGLEQFEKLLVERFGKGLPMFNDDDSEAEEAPEPSAGKKGLSAIFNRGKGNGHGNGPPGLPGR